MSLAVETEGLGKRYRRAWALDDCTLGIPAGGVVGLVGPNGAGKTTLLQLVVGLLRPDAGSIAVLGTRPGHDRQLLSRVAFVAQDSAVYAGLSVDEHLRFGAWTNSGWDPELARDRIARLGLDPRRRAGDLSGGQRAQLALTLAVAKRPELLVLDEPAASLDPLARREFLQSLMEIVAEHGTSVVLSSHLVADLERTCDHLVILVDSRVQVAGAVEELLATHRRLVGPRRDGRIVSGGQQIVVESHTDRQSTLVVRTDRPVMDPSWTVEQLGLEDLVLAYLSRAAARAARRPRPEVRS